MRVASRGGLRARADLEEAASDGRRPLPPWWPRTGERLKEGSCRPSRWSEYGGQQVQWLPYSLNCEEWLSAEREGGERVRDMRREKDGRGGVGEGGPSGALALSVWFPDQQQRLLTWEPGNFFEMQLLRTSPRPTGSQLWRWDPAI